ncbi:hypothetical protein E0L10_01240 [Enterococcus durans]|uniref:oligosaccharide flippase family protein n=1 Tax=Enterococcus durans TaxID=53345 RepID=UPI001431E2B0|nr:oligosaccharide flippase family protein [Enterococcus durans]NJE62847.1 hypothetical protein [Enterococcus durans]
MLNNFYKNFRYVFSSQIFVFIFGVARAFILPIILNVEDYGFFQIYLFYTSYVGIFSLGYNEGIYLRYGQFSMDDLPKRVIKNGNQFHYLLLTGVTMISLLLSQIITENYNMRFVFSLISCNILIFGLNGVAIYIYQITNQLKKYSFFNLLPKVIFVIAILIGYFFKIHNYKYYILLDFLSNLLVIIIMIIDLKDIYTFKKIEAIKLGLNEFIKNVSTGINVMLALFSSMLMVGLGRFILERFTSIEEYSHYSLGITISNMLIILSSALSTILYPTLKRIGNKNYNRIYIKLSSVTFITLVFIPVFYFLAYMFIIFFLKDYISVLKYLILLFGVIGMQSRMQILNNTYYKVLRKEKKLLIANINSVLLFGIFCFQFYFLPIEPANIAFLTFIVTWIRCFLSEIFLLSEMKLPLKNNAVQLLVFLTLILLIWNMSILVSVGIYLLIIIGVIIKYFNNLLQFIRRWSK